MTVNYYGQKLKSNGVPMVAWGLWSFAGILVNLGLRASEVRKLMSEPDPFEAMNKKFWKLRGHLLFKEDLNPKMYPYEDLMNFSFGILSAIILLLLLGIF